MNLFSRRPLPAYICIVTFKLLHTMGIVSTTKGGGKYSAPMIETIEVAAEIGFAASGNVPSSDGISPLGYYDDFYLSENE